MSDKKETIYDGAKFCDEGCGCGCPIVELEKESGRVVISDPSKPENGEFSMTIDEYNLLIKNARPVQK